MKNEKKGIQRSEIRRWNVSLIEEDNKIVAIILKF